MKKITINLESFTKADIEQAASLLTTTDLRFYKNKKSLFYKDENGHFCNITKMYGLKIALIAQFVFNIAYLKAGRHNQPFTIKYKTINEHLGQYKVSLNYLSETINKFVKWKIIKRYRVGRYLWMMQLSDNGYQMLFNSAVGTNAYLLKQMKNSYLIYQFLKEKIRAFRSYCSKAKKRAKLELIKKVIFGLKLFTDDNQQTWANSPPSNKTCFIPETEELETNIGKVSIENIFTKEELEKIF